MSYYIRDEKGTGKLIVPNDIASSIMENTPGFFRKRTTTDNVTSTVYEITEDYSLTVKSFDREIKIFLWKGDLLCPKTN